ncbi:hypothetical protein M422DRAFT_268216 [Sphaerobolus stellatus SS14]|uniref:Protein kinase domain-containing protein n=1 Tax=Sphaerobolus stellatus (strain SS14) TaxID=990650 RepID=A0A0C9TKF9_SPHS4|nr:hypothetical protein M422DRAFT_268216 [Sphaerobolus stellatus SS14]
MISKYQKEVTALLKILMVFCAVSTNIQVQLLRSDGILSGASQTARRANDDIPEFEEFIELKQGHIQLQEEIKGHSDTYYYHDFHYYRAAPSFKEHHALIRVNGNTHLTTVREYKGDAAEELLRADLQILARLKHRDITQVMGFCKCNIFPSIIFYEDLRPIGLGEYRSIDRSWDTLEDIFTKHRMRHGIRAGIDHIKATIPSVLGGERVSEKFRYIQYYPKDTVRLCVYLGNDNRPKLSILPSGMLDNFQDSEPLELTYDQNNVMDEGTLQALHIQFKGRAVWKNNWALYTSAEENNLKHSTTSKGMRLSFTQFQWQKSDSFLLIHSSCLNDDRSAQLRESFIAQLCHLNAKLKNERPCFQCKLTSLRLVSEIHWHINVQLGNHTKAAAEHLLVALPARKSRFTALERHVFEVEAPRLTCSGMVNSFGRNIKPLQELYEFCGLDPFSDDVARAAGVPVPRHFNIGNSKQKRRRSFTVHKDIIHDSDEFRDSRSDFYRYSYKRPKNVRILQEFNSRLGIRAPVHWELLAAAEVLPKYLHWYDLRTTGHEFEYREVDMDPKYDELPSRCRDFMREFQSEGKSLEEMLRIFKH